MNIHHPAGISSAFDLRPLQAFTAIVIGWRIRNPANVPKTRNITSTDQLCPAKADGTRKPSKPYNYILSPNYNHRPRHALRTTWQLVNEYGEAAHFLLSKGPNERGELLEQLAARQFFIGCKGIIETASKLYSDPARNTFKVGSTSQKRRGNIRRYISYLQQLELTYDLYTLPRDEIINMLPAEYSGFLSEQGSA